MSLHWSVRVPALCLVLLLTGQLTGCEQSFAPGQESTRTKNSAGEEPSDVPAEDEIDLFEDEDEDWSAEFGATGKGAFTKRTKTNRLGQSNSPYLLLHAENPVDWFPWGPEAFERARRENKPIFLSIGYSSCHWCHVMERLVFSDVKTARFLNKNFVCIKVDREERPDVDRVYMTGLLTYFQAIDSPQGGGWPLSLFLTPDGHPFMGGTYFPPEGQDGRPGFRDVGDRVVTLWDEKQEAVREFSSLLVTQMRRTLAPTLALKRIEPKRELVDSAADALLESFDPEYGGFAFDARHADEPKFPVGSRLALLQYRVRRFGDERAERALRTTLTAMAEGGLYDHLGGGFHRYSTDREWLVPHFEKMLYDQAQLAAAYTEAFRIGHDQADRRVAEGVLDFVLSDMRIAGGGFASSLDADSDDGVEGAYYVWGRDAIDRVLGAENGELFARTYGVEGKPDLEAGHVLHRSSADANPRTRSRETVSETRLAGARHALLAERNGRKPPRTDDKVLTAWNGLMIGTLAKSGAVLGRDKYVRAAEEAALFLLSNARDDDGHLLRSYRAGRATIPAYVDDYAFLVEGLLVLYETTRDERWFNAARRLTDDQLDLFWDDKGHGFYYTARNGEELVVPVKLSFDDALPAANAISVRNLIRIASISGVPEYRARAGETLAAFAADLERAPLGTSTLALALGEYLDDPNFGALQSRDGANVVGPARFDRPVDERSPRESLQLVSVEESEEEPPGESATKKKDEVLSARAFLEYDKLPAGGKCRILFQLKVAEGWHVNANPPRPDYMKPVVVEVVSKRGIKLGSVRYPKGMDLRDEGLDETLSIYEGGFEVRGVLDVPARAAGAVEELGLIVKYQPCRDGRCLRPQTLELKGRIPVVAATAVKPVNTKHFQRQRR